MPQTLIRPPVVKHFTVDGHPVRVQCERGHGEDEPDPKTLQSPACSLSYVASQCILMMARLSIRRIDVDGCEIRHTNTTVRA
jgi:hypothetical protein